jgi:hypothetical protein
MNIRKFSAAYAVGDKGDEKEVDEDDEDNIEGMDIVGDEMEFLNRGKGH